MQQLGTLDTAFINLESNTTPQHIASFGIYDPSTAPEKTVRYKSLIKTFDRRLKHLPLFRTRLVHVPGGLDRPYWVKDADFDLEFHIRHIRLPQPGDWRQLCISLARLHSRRLDLSRPLWEIYIIEGLDRIKGLPKGCFGIYIKIHYALLDGGAIEQLVTALHDLTPTPPRDKAGPDQVLIDHKPSSAEMLARAAFNNIKNGFSMGRSAARASGQLAAMAYRVARKKMPKPVIGGPETRFNQPVGPHRVFAAATFELEKIRAIKQATGTTVNDVCVAIVSGALRRYLNEHDELPKEPLAAVIPLSNRVEQAGDTIGHELASPVSLLHSDIEEPLERLQAIAQSLTEVKQFWHQTPIAKTVDIAGMVNPLLARSASRIYQKQKLTRFSPAKVATVISNLPGVSVPLYAAGAQLLQSYALGLLSPGMGLFHAVSSYMDCLSISITADRDQLPDPQHYVRCLEESYTQLHQAACKKPARKRTAAKSSAGKVNSTRGAAKTSAEPQGPATANKPGSLVQPQQEDDSLPLATPRKKASLRTTASSGAFVAGKKVGEAMSGQAGGAGAKTQAKRFAEQSFSDLLAEPEAKPAAGEGAQRKQRTARDNGSE
ncbi:MAG: wax ester/triacylglycerol synthase family O-acyltransferase [Pseudomonadales bacterium]|nr:wax ester/triacylglycerol synthase family O-acyltransferase [Pseudomonadales bacterium]